MYLSSVQSVLALLLALNLSLCLAAPPSIGVAVTRGNFSIDQSSVRGNATVFDGSSIETGAGLSQLQLNNGAKLQLGADTKGKVYSNRLILERGIGEVESGKDFQVEALNLRVDSKSGARVAVRNGKTVEVAALTGAVRVSTASGIVVANVLPGTVLSFDPQAAGAAAPSTMTGCLQKSGTAYLLKDETSNVTVELQGAGLEGQVGKRVQVTGAIAAGVSAAGGASQVVKVSNIKVLANKCSSPAGAAAAGGAAAGGAAAGAAAGGAAAAGLSTAVIAGIVIAAGAGLAIGLGVALHDDGQTSPSSR